MVKPIRIQRSRKSGYSMQEHSWSINGLDCVYVGRPSDFGNPFRHEMYGRTWACTTFRDWMNVEDSFRHLRVDQRQTIRHRLHELKGKNLSCWCPLDKPCHADFLIELANRPEGG